MKKILCVLSAITLVLISSCSSDDSSNGAEAILVKKIIYDGDENDFSTVTYNGNKIVSLVENGGFKTNFTYTGDLITKIELLNESNEIESVKEYTYQNGKLASFLEKIPDLQYDTKTVYTHNSDGTVSYADFRVDKTTGKVIDDGGTVGKYTYSSGNLVKKEYSYYGYEYSRTLEYDGKDSPVKNITGYSLLLDDEESSAKSNVTKITYSSSSIEIFTYTYNENGFPTEQFSSYNGKSSGSIKWLY